MFNVPVVFVGFNPVGPLTVTVENTYRLTLHVNVLATAPGTTVETGLTMEYVVLLCVYDGLTVIPNVPVPDVETDTTHLSE